MQVAYQLYGVGYLALGIASEELANGEIGGAPDGLPSQAGYMLVEKQRGTLVGKNHGYL